MCECGEGVGFAEILSETHDDPVGIAQPRRVVGELHWRLRHAAQDGIDEWSSVLRRHGNRRAHRRVRGRAEERELIRAEAEGGARRKVGRMPNEAVGQPIAGSPHAQGAVDELGGEGAVAVREVGTRERGGEGQVGVGPVTLDAHQRFEGHRPRVGRGE